MFNPSEKRPTSQDAPVTGFDLRDEEDLQSQKFMHVWICPEVGQGNPMMVINQGSGAEQIWLTALQAVAQWHHRRMTTNSEIALKYTRADGDAIRTSFPSRLYGFSLAFELHTKLLALHRQHPGRKLHLHFAQEFPLLNAPRWMVSMWKMIGVEHCSIHVSDVYAKDTAIAAASAHPDVEIAVWSRRAEGDAYKRTSTLKQFTLPRVALVGNPFSLSNSAFRQVYERNSEKLNSSDIPPGGMPDNLPKVLIKSSGSGIPISWIEQLIEACCNNQPSFQVHTPQQVKMYNQVKLSDYSAEAIVHQEHTEPIANFRDGIHCFYAAVSPKLQTLVSYPSEMSALVSALRDRGQSIQFFALPPRGKHELRNLLWLHEEGLLTGLVWFNGADVSEVRDLYGLPDELTVIPITQLGKTLAGSSISDNDTMQESPSMD